MFNKSCPNRFKTVLLDCFLSRSSAVVLFVVALLCLSVTQAAQAQSPPCPTSSSNGNFTFTPQSLGDSMTVTIDLAPCETIILTESHDMGGDGNRGTNVKITYQNSATQPIHDETIFGFNTGTYTFPAWVPWPYP